MDEERVDLEERGGKHSSNNWLKGSLFTSNPLFVFIKSPWLRPSSDLFMWIGVFVNGGRDKKFICMWGNCCFTTWRSKKIDVSCCLFILWTIFFPFFFFGPFIYFSLLCGITGVCNNLASLLTNYKIFHWYFTAMKNLSAKHRKCWLFPSSAKLCVLILFLSDVSVHEALHFFYYGFH